MKCTNTHYVKRGWMRRVSCLLLCKSQTSETQTRVRGESIVAQRVLVAQKFARLPLSIENVKKVQITQTRTHIHTKFKTFFLLCPCKHANDTIVIAFAESTISVTPTCSSEMPEVMDDGKKKVASCKLQHRIE